MSNLRAIGLMVAAVAAFAVTDAFIKGITRTIPVGQALLLMSLGNLVWFLPRTLLAGHRLFSRDALAPAVVIRSLGEASGSFGIVAALAVLPLATVSAIMQAQPLVVMMVAAIFLGEEVGWRRWVAVGVGFAGVLVILRPDASFDLNMLWPLFGVIGLTARDIGTRILPRRISADFAITWAVILLVALGAGLTLGHSGHRNADLRRASGRRHVARHRADRRLRSLRLLARATGRAADPLAITIATFSGVGGPVIERSNADNRGDP